MGGSLIGAFGPPWPKKMHKIHTNFWFEIYGAKFGIPSFEQGLGTEVLDALKFPIQDLAVAWICSFSFPFVLGFPGLTLFVAFRVRLIISIYKHAGFVSWPQETSSHDVTDILLGDNDLVQVKDGIVMVRRVATLEDVLADFEIVEMEKVELPEGVTPLSPILQLTPENHEFDTPVHLIIPVCVGATKAWRSCPDGWEELREAVFFQGYMRVSLTHFCLIFAGDREVKAADTVAVPFYRHEDNDNGIQVRWAVCHLECKGCVERLERKRRAYLDGFLQCEGDFDLGTKMHQSEIEIRSNTGAPGVPSEQSSDKFILDFGRFPLVRPGGPSFLPQGCFLLRLEVPLGDTGSGNGLSTETFVSSLKTKIRPT